MNKARDERLEENRSERQPLSVEAQTLQEKKEIERAKAFVKSKGLTWGGQGDYGTKGLYTYSAGKYRGKAYFGIGGKVSQQSAPVRKPKERIPGWLVVSAPSETAGRVPKNGTIPQTLIPGIGVQKEGIGGNTSNGSSGQGKRGAPPQLQGIRGAETPTEESGVITITTSNKDLVFFAQNYPQNEQWGALKGANQIPAYLYKGSRSGSDASGAGEGYVIKVPINEVVARGEQIYGFGILNVDGVTVNNSAEDWTSINPNEPHNIYRNFKMLIEAGQQEGHNVKISPNKTLQKLRGSKSSAPQKPQPLAAPGQAPSRRTGAQVDGVTAKAASINKKPAQGASTTNDPQLELRRRKSEEGLDKIDNIAEAVLAQEATQTDLRGWMNKYTGPRRSFGTTGSSIFAGTNINGIRNHDIVKARLKAVKALEIKIRLENIKALNELRAIVKSTRRRVSTKEGAAASTRTIGLGLDRIDNIAEAVLAQEATQTDLPGWMNKYTGPRRSFGTTGSSIFAGTNINGIRNHDIVKARLKAVKALEIKIRLENIKALNELRAIVKSLK